MDINLNGIPDLKEKIKHFDHHATESENKKYLFVNVVLDKNGEVVCGTSLLHDYFVKNELYGKDLNAEKVQGFVEATRCRDNWLKQMSGYSLGCDLSELALMYGNDTYINKMCEALSKGKQLISDTDRELIQRRYDEIEKYIKKCDDRLVFMNLNGRNIGVSFSEQYRSEVGNALSRRHTDLDYFLIVNMMRGQYSLRTTRDDVHVGNIAQAFNPSGGGHPKAAGFDINNNTIWIMEAALNQIKVDNKNKLIRKRD